MITRKYTFFVIFLSITLTACGGGGGGGGNNEPVAIDLWTWVSGSDIYEGGQKNTSTLLTGSTTEYGTISYGTIGIANAANVPGARQGAMTWADASGDFWLFGGLGHDSAGTYDRLNDLWRWDGSNWTWISGSNTAAGAQSPTYGAIGVANAANVPGARNDGITWIDSFGDFWLFGGFGYDSGGNLGRLNDLWKWDGTNWTWVSGNNTRNQNGTYGTINVAAGTNVPGSRSYAVGWIDSSDNLWLFGGSGYGASGSSCIPSCSLNDLWRWDGTNWTWMSGSDTRNQSGVYNTINVADPTSIPGGRQAVVSWIDTSGNLWLFGGFGYDSAGSLSQLNDLWRWDGTNWTWISGSDTVESVGNPDVQHGSYGTRGTASASNIPGARFASTVSKDSSGRVWLFGGQGFDSDLANTTGGRLNDLWRWDGSNWTWISGSNLVDQDGVYGVLGTADTANVPGARNYAASWIDTSGNFWLFGGTGFDSSGVGTADRLNDLWRYQP